MTPLLLVAIVAVLLIGPDVLAVVPTAALFWLIDRVFP